jgi:hypothetical protein
MVISAEMLVSRPGLGLETVQDHFLVVLVLVSIGPVLVSVLVSNTGSKKVLVGLGHCRLCMDKLSKVLSIIIVKALKV